MILIVGGAFQGKSELALSLAQRDKILFGFHLKVREIIKNGGDAEKFARDTLNGGYEVIVSDDISCGVIPIEASERIIREETGRALCILAAACDEVYRVQCGIGVKIKGGERYV